MTRPPPREYYTFALLPYDDGSGSRLDVRTGYVFEGEQVLRVNNTTIQVRDIDIMIGALRAAQRYYTDLAEEHVATRTLETPS